MALPARPPGLKDLSRAPALTPARTFRFFVIVLVADFQKQYLLERGAGAWTKS